MIDTVPYCKSLGGKPVAVIGLGLSGLATAKALVKGGCLVTAWDDDAEKRRAAQQYGISLRSYEEGFAGYGGMILAPGIPLHFPVPHPAVAKARAAGVPIIGDLEIFHRCLPGVKTVGITGTNGKSTTTALITHILNANGYNAIAAGNIGTPLLDIVMDDPQKTDVIIEISSYQMDLCADFRPDIAVLLNFSADHLDRHGGMDGYIASKERIFEGAGIAVCGVDDDHARIVYDKIKSSAKRNVIAVSGHENVEGGIFVSGGVLTDATGQEHFISERIDNIPSLLGAHNFQNLCAAYAVCKSMRIEPSKIIEAARTFPGLPHRQQIVRVINGVSYINDSKATNAEAASRAVSSYRNIYLIAGGRAKEGGLEGLEPFFGNVRHVFLIGEAEDDFAAWFHKNGVPFTKVHDLNTAVAAAHEAAQKTRGETVGAGCVLLSPACASWDQFRSFEHRGSVFIEAVNALQENGTS